MPTNESRGNPLTRFLGSPANWCGLAFAIAVLVLRARGMVGVAGLLVAAVGYLVGFLAGGLWFGFPSAKEPTWEALDFKDEGDARQAMERALNGVRQLTQYNPGNRIPASLQARVLELCTALEGLLQQWERSRGSLSLQDSFHARHIAISYLPEALNTYLSIPPAYATTRIIDNGKTAQDIFKDTIAELEAKVRELGDDLASQDAHAFLVHSRFLKQKFGGPPIDDGDAPTMTPPAPPPKEPSA